MKKILVVDTVPLHLNGISSVIMNLYQASCHQFDYTIITNEEADPSYKRMLLSKDSLMVFPSRKTELLNYLKQFRKLIKKNHYSVLHIHGNSETMVIEGLVAKVAGFSGKIIFHTHNSKKSNFLYRKFNPLMKFLGDQYIACGMKAGENLYGDAPFMIIKNGIFLKKYQFNREAKEKFIQKYDCQGKKILGHIGRFNHQKNQLFLLELMDYWKKNNPSFLTKVHLFLVGEGEKKEEIAQYLIQKKLQQHITIINGEENPEAFYSFFDYFLLPSFFEGFPMVAVESQAAGLPGIYSDQMDPKVKVGLGVTFASINENEDTFKKWGNLIKKDIWQREELSVTNQKQLQAEGFDIAQVAEELATVYEDGKKR